MKEFEVGKMTEKEILVVDDTVLNLKLLLIILKKAGYKVRSANNGELALQSVKENPPALILLDIKMPVIDGFEVCKRLKADEVTSQIPIIFISALNDEKSKVKGFQVGAVDFIIKPFHSDEVLARIKTHLELREIQDLLEDQNKRLINEIAERKLAEESLKQSELQLSELNASKDRLFSIIAHDLKTPFNAILGLSNVIKEKALVKDYKGLDEFAEVIQNASQQAMDLLTNLLEWSRSQSGRMDYIPENIELGILVKEVMVLLNQTAQQKSIKIEKRIPDNVTIFADNDMISTVLRNLISNAIKFSNTGGKIVVSAEINQNELIVSVSDNGVGIQKDSMDKLFRIEENFSTVGTQYEKGTGLGLLICKDFISKHGGKIWAKSEPGKGSTFSFSIPKIDEIK